MGYDERIKDFEPMRAYIREFYVNGFKTRREFTGKSLKTYDNAIRRVKSWLDKYLRSEVNKSGQPMVISIDSRTISHNPLYAAFKTMSFTDNDIVMYFCLLDMLRDRPMTAHECTEALTNDYLKGHMKFENTDESTIRKKLIEYEKMGILKREKQKGRICYSINSSSVDIENWSDAINFFSEVAPLGVIGSFFDINDSAVFGYKHDYLLDALDNEIMLRLLEAVQKKESVVLTIFKQDKDAEKAHRVLPVRFYISTQTGRQYVLVYDYKNRGHRFFRLDTIRTVRHDSYEADYSKYVDSVKNLDEYCWNVAGRTDCKPDHLELYIHVEPDEMYIVERLNREKRHGTVDQVDGNTWCFNAEVYDVMQMIPWIRTFTGRIDNIVCTNEHLVKHFDDELQALKVLYGGEENAAE